MRQTPIMDEMQSETSYSTYNNNTGFRCRPSASQSYPQHFLKLLSVLDQMQKFSTITQALFNTECHMLAV